MPSLGFSVLKERLANGSKLQTIRKQRKKPIKVGDILIVYWDLRTKSCMKIGEAKVTKIIRKRFKDITYEDAVRDGFQCLQDFRLAFRKMHPDLLYIDGRGEIQERPPYEGFDIITFEWVQKNKEFFTV